MDQTSFVSKLEDEVGALRACFNSRIEFFRHLQKFSDTVSDVKLYDKIAARTLTVQEKLEALKRPSAPFLVLRSLCSSNCLYSSTSLDAEEANKLVPQTRGLVAAFRHLQSLKDTHDAGEIPEEDRECVIVRARLLFRTRPARLPLPTFLPSPVQCREDIESGVLLECAHIFCASCFDDLRMRPGVVACPICRKEVQPSKASGAPSFSLSHAVELIMFLSDDSRHLRTEECTGRGRRG